MLLAGFVASQSPPSTLTIFSEVANTFHTDVSLFINDRSAYPAPLAQRTRLIHTVHSTGKVVLLAKVTNTPGYRSATTELVLSPGSEHVFLMGVTSGTNSSGEVWLLDITANTKQRAKLEAKKDKWAIVTSEENMAEPYVR